MRFSKMITCIDTHTCGEPTRIVTGGIGFIPGDTVAEKMLYFQENLDWLRTMLMHEPRGQSVMSGAILTEPCDPAADVGVIYLETGGYLPMCGHDTIGVCTALVECGMVLVSEPVTVVTLETPAGLVEGRVKVENGVAQSVTFTNAASFVYDKDIRADIQGLGEVTLDIAYGGNFFALVDAHDVGIKISPEYYWAIRRIGTKIKDAVNEVFPVVHPEKPFINAVTHVYFIEQPVAPGMSGKSAAIITNGDVDRSPCGTGTCAELALMYSEKKIGLGEVFLNESIIGTTLSAKVVSESSVSNFPAVICEVEGAAYITGFHNYVIDPMDPLKEGFLLQ